MNDHVGRKLTPCNPLRSVFELNRETVALEQAAKARSLRLPAMRDHASPPDLQEACAAIANCFTVSLAAALKARPSAGL